MIRSVVMVKLVPDHDAAEVARISAAFRALNLPGTVSYTIGNDLGLREGGWSLAIVADFIDEAAYRNYDLDAEHNRLRGEIAQHAEQIARVQFALDD